MREVDMLNLEIESKKPLVIDAYIEVFGEKYRKHIEQNVKKTITMPYITLENVKGRYNFLMNCKRNELYIKFLEKIGINLKGHKTDNYLKLAPEIEKLVTKFLGNDNMDIDATLEGFDSSGIKSFEDDRFFKGQQEDKQIDFVSFILRRKKPFTKEEYKEFRKTKKYELVLKSTKHYLAIYKEILEEYREYVKENKTYEDYIEKEKQRQDDLKDMEQKLMYQEIQKYISPEILERLKSVKENSSNIVEQLYGGTMLKSNMEYFSAEDEKKLKSEDTNYAEKETIIGYRKAYFKQLGFDSKTLENMTEEEFSEFLDRKDVRNLIPDETKIEEISKIRKEHTYNLEAKIITENDSYKKAVSKFKGSEEHTFSVIKDRSVCESVGVTSKKTNPILYYTIRPGENGLSDHTLLHEYAHCISENSKWPYTTRDGGFEFTLSDVKNPYCNQYRKYERLNENFTDIFAMQARKRLHEKGIYMMDSKEHVQKNVSDNNTSSITKNILMPFLERFKDVFVGAYVIGDKEGLFNRIGKGNFEQLNDIINKVDDLCSKGLNQAIKVGNKEDTLIDEYKKELARAKQVYSDMEKTEELMSILDENEIETDELLELLNSDEVETDELLELLEEVEIKEEDKPEIEIKSNISGKEEDETEL